ncbi:MAG: radical SAM protein [Chloroflexi bacterium]|nr:radical SAM protein [Chloroflexota bacterium]
MQGTPFDFFVQWHLTERCNLRCRHCYQQGTMVEMGYREVASAVENVADTIESWATTWELQVSPSFHVTGGEPLLRDDLLAVLDHARGRGFSTALLTNGTLITSDAAQGIADSQVTDVQVSLDGLESVHDSIRGRGSFDRALQGIQNLVSQGVDTSINVTVSRRNAGEVDGLIHLAAHLGISAVCFSRLVPCGSGQAMSEETLTAEELRDLYSRTHQLDGQGGVAVISRDPLASVANIGADVPDVDFPVGGCAAGVSGVTIACDGSVMPCRRMNLSIGNIRTQSFREIWAESPVLWALRERDRYHDGCNSCRYWPVCRGCRAVALAYSRARGGEDYLGPDPQCVYRQPMA